jgi:hypothetical protein
MPLLDAVKDLPTHLRRSLAWGWAREPKWPGTPFSPWPPTLEGVSANGPGELHRHDLASHEPALKPSPPHATLAFSWGRPARKHLG